MRMFKQRPLAFFAAVFVISTVFLIGLPPRIKPVVIAVAAASAALYSLAACVMKPTSPAVKRLTFSFVSAALAVALSASLMYFTVDADILVAEKLIGREASITATVREIKSETVYSGAYTVELLSVDGEHSDLFARLETEFSADLSVGDVIKLDVTFAPLTDDGAYDLKTNSFRHGITLLAVSDDVDSLRLIGERKSAFAAIERLRERISAVLEVSSELSGGDFGLTSALFVGDKSALDGTVNRDFSYVGISHLLAVSGMHLTVLIGGLEYLLKKLTLHRVPRTLILIVTTVLYMGLTGFSPAILRAGIMLIIYQLSYFVGREADGVTSLFVSVAVIIAASPFSAADVGLLLSFSAMLACIAASESMPEKVTSALSRLSRKGRLGRILSRGIELIILNLSMSCYALIFTFPVMWQSFGHISLLSPVGTVLLFIPITLILYLAPFVVLTFRIPWLWTLVAYPCSRLCRLSAEGGALLSRIDGAEVLLPIGDIFSAIVSLLVVICLLLSLSLPKRASRIAGCIAVAIFVTLSVSSVYYREAYDKNTVYYLNFGKNEGFVVADGAHSLVVDISNGGSYITSAAVEYAAEELRSDVDAYMLTHLHRRHIRTLRSLLESEYIDRVYLPSPTDDASSAIYSELVRVAEKYGVDAVTYVLGHELTYGDISIDTASAAIERSTQPVQLLAFESEGKRTAYIGSSVHESSLYSLALDVCRNSEHIIFGIHGPVPKGGADYRLTDSQSVTYATSELEKLFSEYAYGEKND